MQKQKMYTSLLVLIFLMWSATETIDARASKEAVKDSSGKVLYFLETKNDRVNVLNGLGVLLGYIKNGNTYNIHGSMVSKGKAPHLLLK